VSSPDPTRLSKSVIVGIAVLTDGAFFTVLTPLLPSFGRMLDIGPMRLGVLVSMYPLGALVGAWPSAILATRQGTGRTLAYGLVVLAASIAGLGFGSREWLLDASRFLGGVGACCVWTGGLSAILHSTPANARGRGIAVAMSGSLVGSLVGPLIGGIAFSLGRASVFAITAGLVSLLAVCVLIRHDWGAWSANRISVRGLLRQPRVKLSLWMNTVPAFLVGVVSVLGPIRLDAEGLGGRRIAIVFVIAGGVAALIAHPVGRWLDAQGTQRTLRSLLVAAFAASAILAIDWSSTWIGAAIGTAGILYAALGIPAAALMADTAETADLGFAYGVALGSVAWSLGSVLGSTAAGFAAGPLGNRLPFLLAGTAALIPLVVSGRGLTLES
jgi:DHA1 family multidrug resistance protein-like MFS transporter